MLARSCISIVTVMLGLSVASAASALEVGNGLSVNGLSVNGLSVNGLSVNGLGTNGLGATGSSSDLTVKAVILQDGSRIALK